MLYIQIALVFAGKCSTTKFKSSVFLTFTLNISLLENNLGKQIEDLKDDIQNSNENFKLKLTNLSTEFKNEIAVLKEELKTQNEEIHSKIESLENKLNSLDIVVSKKVWKIAVSIVAGASLLLNILSVLGIL